MKYKIITYISIIVFAVCLSGCGKKNAEIDYKSKFSKNEKVTNSYQQFEVDVEKERLYGNDMGEIVDVYGKVLKEYSYLKIVDNGNISNGEYLMEGYMMSDSGKIINAFIRSGTANDINEWTGVYKDTTSEGSGDEIIIVQDGDTATYEFADTKEINCQIDGENLRGTMWYFMKNPDGTLSVTSGAGGWWGQYEKINNEAKIDVSDWNNVINASDDNNN